MGDATALNRAVGRYQCASVVLCIAGMPQTPENTPTQLDFIMMRLPARARARRRPRRRYPTSKFE